jgi:hypothetical protein
LKRKKGNRASYTGRTIRLIAPEVHMSFRDISTLIKEYDKKIRKENTRKVFTYGS